MARKVGGGGINMNYKYTIIKDVETINCDGCKYWGGLLTSKPCCLCAGARLDSSRNYYAKKERKK